MTETIFAIGALGGSGTRVVAEVLKKADIFLGTDLNLAFDNLLFTRLFKNPIWYESATREEKLNRFEIFRKCMVGEPLEDYQKKEIIQAANANPVFKSEPDYFLKSICSERKNESFLTNIWGWKEPNTHLYLEELSIAFSNFKYIHLVRNGLDMAFSSNNQQLKNWGYKFDIDWSEKMTKAELASAQLTYWIKSNNEAISKANNLFGANFHLLNYEMLYRYPMATIHNLLNFLDVKTSEEQLRRLECIPKSSFRNDRYLNEKTDIFSSEQLEGVAKLGSLLGKKGE